MVVSETKRKFTYEDYAEDAGRRAIRANGRGVDNGGCAEHGTSEYTE